MDAQAPSPQAGLRASGLRAPTVVPADVVVLEVSSSLGQPSLFYHLGVRESFSMTNNVLLCSQADLPDLQALRVGGQGASGGRRQAGVALPKHQYLNVCPLQEDIFQKNSVSRTHLSIQSAL